MYSFIKRKIQYLNVPGKTADNAENVQEIMLTKNIQRNLASFSGEMGVDNDVEFATLRLEEITACKRPFYILTG